mmetsp:Transcript_24848/g.82793  ORF Transcript_24848/g.82793 Transcript_24848/m.82793 type:complete len:372 (+) Transcript_24848:68-1183(+)|eukprot:CAMPEP_0204139104 /NCGR_PEP_ID=MMETSP0361-20130328/18303_1 /ASSEMBLY_ACC=CAM_ASM_000343 /TAXON_ID=268821 /ORGANISM="Scrippsiella Hangoei, Strain SHTV-5" /LENGTH=371 /DNA_ID=CAMNT_0051092897 /DNA_START=67 /DNA_END=1182 /DNA_ORIENTATION=+
MAPSRVAPRLIGLLAAHFAAQDHGRVDRLRRLLHSVEGQTRRVPLLVSWSAEDAPAAAEDIGRQSVAERAAAVFGEFEELGVVYAMPRLRGRSSQFEHYSRLQQTMARHVKADRQPLVFFTDDDDIWHPQRAEEYLAAATQHPEAEVLACRMHISPGLAPRLPPDASAQEVSRRQAAGEFRVTLCDEKPSEGLFGTATGEYFDIAVAWQVFESFFRRHNEAVIGNCFADIRFRTFLLRWPGCIHRFLPHGYSDDGQDEAPWMYFYDRPTEAYTTPTTEEDLRYVCDDLPDVERISGIRQTLDCVLFQLAPTRPPLQITDLQFAQKLVGILRDQNRGTVLMALDRCRIHGVQVVGGADTNSPWAWPPPVDGD